MYDNSQLNDMSEKLRHPDSRVVRTNAEKLLEFGLGKLTIDDQVLCLLTIGHDDELTAIVEMGDKAVEPLVKLMNNPDCECSISAAECLVWLETEQAKNAILNNFDNFDNSTKESVLEAIGCLDHPVQFFDFLCKVIEQSERWEEKIYTHAIVALGAISTPKSVAKLKEFLDFKGPEEEHGLRTQRYRLAAVTAFGRMGTNEASDIMFDLLEKKHPLLTDREIQKTAIEAFGCIGDQRSIDYIIGALDNSDDDVVHTAAATLYKIGFDKAGLDTKTKAECLWVLEKEEDLLRLTGGKLDHLLDIYRKRTHLLKRQKTISILSKIAQKIGICQFQEKLKVYVELNPPKTSWEKRSYSALLSNVVGKLRKNKASIHKGTVSKELPRIPRKGPRNLLRARRHLHA